jgi:WD40 repeat protein
MDKSHTRIIWDCAWAPDGTVFATASRDKTVRVEFRFFFNVLPSKTNRRDRSGYGNLSTETSSNGKQ